ncbi:MAG: 4Fe-4S binding protein [Bacteroidetes bacterium]|nr:4Fe-4S binding protein [Bacteroidota bacterium]
MNAIINYLKELFGGIKTLLTGMSVTGYYFVHPKAIITQQYPENRKTLKMFDRFKGEVTMPHDENNQHKCTACSICEINCPNGSIEVISKQVEKEDGKTKKELDIYKYHLDMCTFCGICIKVCPQDAIIFSQGFEHAVFNKAKLIKTLNKPGSSLKEKVKEVKEVI